MSTARDPQTSLRSDWQRLLRQAALNTDSPEAIEVCNTLLWLSTYANADGTNAHPGVETIRHLKGCSYDRASTMLAVGCELGLLMRQRRPNDTTVYRLMIPVILPLRWEDSPAFAKLTNSRHKQRHAKAREEKRRTVSAPTVRTMSAPGVPDHERAGGSEIPQQTPDHERAHPRTMGTAQVPDHERAGGVHPPAVTKDSQMDEVFSQQPVRAHEDPDVTALHEVMRVHCATCIDCSTGFAGCSIGRNIVRLLDRQIQRSSPGPSVSVQQAMPRRIRAAR